MAEIKGGEGLKKALDRIALGLSNASVVDVGFLAGGTYPDGTSIPLVAALNEYGKSPSQPPRPFFRNMIAEKSKEWPDDIQKLLVAHGYDGKATLTDMGEVIKGELADSIVKLTSPPLKPATIARKGSDKPLVETGTMLRSIGYAVKD
jgi:hypothetical protein